MKKIISITGLISTVFLGGVLSTFAYTPYYNTYQNTAVSNSYVYVEGCYTYQYDAYTRRTSLIGSTCSTTNAGYGYGGYGYNNTMYTIPVSTSYSASYSYPVTTSYPVATSYPVTTAYTPNSPYYTYGYTNGSWYPGYQNSILGDLFTGNSYNTSYYNGYNNNYGNYGYNCSYQNGYQVCY